MNLGAKKIIFIIDPKWTMSRILVQFVKFMKLEVYKTKYECIIISGRISGNMRCWN